MNQPALNRKVHYAGKLRWTRKGYTTNVFPGYAACCSGPLAQAVQKLGNNTLERPKVTCKRCLERLTWSDQTP